MRLTLAQLRKLPMPYKCNEKLDLSSELNHFEDIISIQPVEVEYEIKERGLDTYLLNMHFEVDLVFECAITLKEVPYHIAANAEELFSTDESYEDAFIIENQTLDTKEAVLTNLLIQKPMRITLDEASFEDDAVEDEVEENINPAFAKLKDLL